MYQASALFEEKIIEDSRSFDAKLICGENSAGGIRTIAVEAKANNGDYVSIGGTAATYATVIMQKPDFAMENQEIELQIGVFTGDTFEYCSIGKFTVQKPSDDDGLLTFTAYDRMVSKLAKPYFSELLYPADGKAVLQELSVMSGVPLGNISELPNGVMIPKRKVIQESTYDENGYEVQNVTYVNPFDGYTYREALGYIAQFYAKFAAINRNGEIELRWYKQTDYVIPASRYYDDLVKNERNFALGTLECTVGESTLTSGSGVTGMQIENPVMTQESLNNVYTKLVDFAFLPMSLSFLGDPRLDTGDIVRVQDKYGSQFDIPIMKLGLDFDGGLITSVESQGKTEAESESGIKGPTAQQIDRVYQELLLIKEVIGNKASFDDLNAINAEFKVVRADYGEFKKLYADKIEATEGRIDSLHGDFLNYQTVVAENIKATNAKIDTVYGDLADYKEVVAEQLNAVNANIDLLDTKYAAIDLANVKNGSITTAMIGTGVVGAAQIADGSITDAKIVGLTANKITAGTLSVERLIISGSNESIIYAINNAGDLVSKQVDTIDGDVLTERSVTTDKIVANAITANEIAAETITANEIAANAVTASAIAAGAVTTEKLEAGAVTADKLSAYSITADKLEIGLGGNLYNLGCDIFDNAPNAPYYAAASNTTVSITSDAGYVYYGKKALKYVTGNTATSSINLGTKATNYGCIPVQPGKYYCLSCYAKSTKAGVSCGLAAVEHTSIGDINAKTSGYVTKTVGTDWTRLQATFQVPENYPYISVQLRVLSSEATVYFDGIMIEEVSGPKQQAGPFKPAGVTYIDGENIITPSLSAISANIGEVTAGKIKSADYDYTQGDFSNSGIMIDLDASIIRTPGLYVTSSGDAYFKGDVNATSGTMENVYITGKLKMTGSDDITWAVPGSDGEILDISADNNGAPKLIVGRSCHSAYIPCTGGLELYGGLKIGGSLTLSMGMNGDEILAQSETTAFNYFKANLYRLQSGAKYCFINCAPIGAISAGNAVVCANTIPAAYVPVVPYLNTFSTRSGKKYILEVQTTGNFKITAIDAITTADYFTCGFVYM